MSDQTTPHQQAYTYCAYCPKICRFSCPVSEATQNESHSAWGKMTAAQLVTKGQRPLDDDGAKALHACTGCGKCKSFCKHENEVGIALFAARGVAIKEGRQPKGAASTVATFAQSKNPFGEDLGPLVSKWKAETPVRYPLFPGCSSLSKRPELISDALHVAQAFGAPMGVCKASANCCGYPLYAAGAFDEFKAHAQDMAKSLTPYPELVVMDPGCAHTLKVVYAQFDVKVPARVRTIYEVLDDNLPHAPEIPPLDETAGYHDACHLGRGLGQYEEPRALLRRAVKQVDEAASIKSEGGCAGGGGLLPRTMPDAAVEVARRQGLEVAPDGGTVVTACPTSRRMFDRAGKNGEDLLTLLKRWLDSANDKKGAAP